MKLVTFTLEEANRVIAEIQPCMERLLEAKREYDLLQGRIEVLTLAVSGASKQNPDTVELAALHQRRNELSESVAREVSAIHRHGCLVKDLEKGLVDFYALAGDRLVFLCWQVGETEIQHWHTLEGGYSERQPLHQELD